MLIFGQKYSRVHISSDEVFSKILKKPSIVQKKMIPHMKAFGLFNKMKQTNKKIPEKNNSKWPPKKKVIFQLRQFSIFFCENFMDWSFGQQRHKPKNSLKTPKMHFLPVFELMSDSLTTIQVEPHQCPCINQSYTSKDQSQKFSRKNIESWRSPENDFCLVFSFLVFGYWVVQKICFFVFSQ